MITFKKGNIFEQEVDAIVNPVNCVGVMGKGLALEFKKRYNRNYYWYLTKCSEKNIKLGNIFIYTETDQKPPLTIINFPTKYHWRDKSCLSDIEKGLDDLIEHLPESVKSIAFPALGCGLGGLDWKDVKSIMQAKLEPLETNCVVLEPQ